MKESTKRPPVVAVVGHIDHGKSTLLDYIRKTNIVEGEAGGITQHLSAYEVEHTTKEGAHARITFLDTPGHAAFQKMRSRGLEVADVAVLVVSAEEGVKPQTIEAMKLIVSEKVPCIVAINKIDKPGANIDRTKNSLIEHEIYIEGMGGDIPWVGISAKRGDGIPELLDLIVLSAELQELDEQTDTHGTGTVIEANVDPRKGISATLIIRKGKVESGMYVVAGESIAPVRIMENFIGKPIKEAHAGSPIRIIGFSTLPQVGGPFHTVENKKQAEAESAEARIIKNTPAPQKSEEGVAKAMVPIIIKADAVGTADAILHELAKIPQDRLELRVVSQGVGAIAESDVKLVSGGTRPGVILGFNVKVEASAKELAERTGVAIQTFDIIYKLAEWIEEQLPVWTPKEMVEDVIAEVKILKIFSEAKGKVVLGGRVEKGLLEEGAQFKIMRRDLDIGRGKVSGLQSQKAPVKRVEEGVEFGGLVETRDAVAPGDMLIAFRMTER